MTQKTPSALEQTTPAAPPPGAPPRPPTDRPPRKSRAGLVWLVVLIAAGVAAWYFWPRGGGAQAGTTPAEGGSGRGGRKGGRGGGGPAPVVVTKARRGNIGVYLTGLGNVTPIYTVTVRSRVDGQLMDIHYKEGDTVKKGEPLVEIDPRPFQVQLEQAEGQQARDQALLNNARVDLARYQSLLQQNAIPEQQVSTTKALVAQYEGTVKADQGQIDSAKLNLAYTHIAAPITGKIGLRLMDPGNIVHASDPNGLLVITQVEPISVIFTIPEDQLPQVQRRLRGGHTLRVDAWDREFKNRIAAGTLATLDNQIDQTTGTIRLRAHFDNTDNALFPNQFVNARLLVEEKQGVTLLPSAAIQRTTTNTYVFVVKPDNTVTVRNITVGTTEGEESEITSGLEPGETVVMTGVDKLNEGSKVNPQMQGEGGRSGGRGARGGTRPAGEKPTDAVQPNAPGPQVPGGRRGGRSGGRHQ